MKRIFLLLVFQTLLILCPFVGSAQFRDPPSYGDSPPPLHIRKWLKGEPTSDFEMGKSYVVEFSSPWCGPCLVAIPHLHRMAERYGDRIRIISVYGMSTVKNDPEDAEYSRIVERLISSLDTVPGYDIAIDSANTTVREWGVRGIPVAFVVNPKGNIVWSGNPLQGLDSVLARLVKTGFVPYEAARSQFAKRESIFSIHQHASKDWFGAVRKLDSLLRLFPDDPGLLSEKYRILVLRDEKQAEQYLNWLIDSNISSISWLSLAADTWAQVENPNIELSIKAHNLALLQLPNPSRRGWFESMINLYQKKGRVETNPELKRAMFRKAIEICEQAVVHSRTHMEEHVAGFETRLLKLENQLQELR